jgi:GNAT superfamily N-acetyltransferase
LPFKREVFSLLNECFSGFYGFVSLTAKQVDTYASKYFRLLHPSFVVIVLDGNERVAAFGITMPSLSEAFQRCRGRLLPSGVFHVSSALRHNHRADMYLMAVRPSLQGKGVNALILDRMAREYRKAGVHVAETNPELETNERVISQWKMFEHRQHKRRRCYGKGLDGFGVGEGSG